MTHTGGWVAPMDDDPFHELIYRDPDLIRVDFDEIVSGNERAVGGWAGSGAIEGPIPIAEEQPAH